MKYCFCCDKEMNDEMVIEGFITYENKHEEAKQKGLEFTKESSQYILLSNSKPRRRKIKNYITVQHDEAFLKRFKDVSPNGYYKGNVAYAMVVCSKCINIAYDIKVKHGGCNRPL